MIVDLIQAVVARFNAETGRTGLLGALPPVPLFIGEQYLNQNDSPPRIVAVPTQDNFGPPMRIGMDQRSLRTCHNGWEIGLWGPDALASPSNALTDFEVVRRMRDDFVVALHRELRGRFGESGASVHLQPQDFELRGAKWSTPGQLTALGFVVIFDVSFKTPVLVAEDMVGAALIKTVAGDGEYDV